MDSKDLAKQYLLARIKIDENSQCWEFTDLNYCGYGKAGKYGRAHRASYEAFIGPIGVDANGKPLFVCHKCDNPACINPEHLFLGTHADNMADKRAKGRCAKPFLGKQLPEETKAKISEAKLGSKHTALSKLKISESLKAKPKKLSKCPYCGITGRQNNMTRYHFSNCKQRGFGK